jgi:hypothetical protein
VRIPVKWQGIPEFVGLAFHQPDRVGELRLEIAPGGLGRRLQLPPREICNQLSPIFFAVKNIKGAPGAVTWFFLWLFRLPGLVRPSELLSVNYAFLTRMRFVLCSNDPLTLPSFTLRVMTTAMVLALVLHLADALSGNHLGSPLLTVTII